MSTSASQLPASKTAQDVTIEIGNFAGNPAIESLREQKPQIFTQVQAYYEAAVEPAEPGEISLAERAFIAQRVAAGIPSPVLAAWYRQRLKKLGENIDESTPRMRAILARIELVNTNPDVSTPEDIQVLRDAGLSQAAIIALSQLIAFVHYQARLLAGLSALGTQS